MKCLSLGLTSGVHADFPDVACRYRTCTCVSLCTCASLPCVVQAHVASDAWGVSAGSAFWPLWPIPSHSPSQLPGVKWG